MIAPTVKTDSDTGRREYWIDTVARPRWMRSLTTALKAGANESLIYAAGKLGMDATRELACEVALDLAALVDGTDDGITNEDIERVYGSLDAHLDMRMGERFGRAKKPPFGIKPPHMGAWGRKADTGSDVHNAIEIEVKLRLGLPTPPRYDTSGFTDEQLAGSDKALAAWEAWKARNDFTPLASEEVVYMEGWEDAGTYPEQVGQPRYDFAARIDLLCEVKGLKAILDIKTGKVGRDGPYPNQYMQVECQRRAWNARHPDNQADLAGILHVPAAGGPVMTYTNLGRDRDADFVAFDLLNGFSRWLFGPPGRE